MRARSFTINTKNEEEFLNTMKRYDVLLSKENKSARSQLWQEDILEDNYNLGYQNTFAKEIINVTDTRDYICMEDNRNLYQLSLAKKDLFLDNRALTDTNQKKKTKTGGKIQDDSEFLLINSKIENSDQSQRLKILMVGDESSGKTYFIRNHFCNKNIRENIWEKTLPTSSEAISLEIIDTNTLILNSPLIQTYLRICNAFILICDFSRPSSITFLEMQLEKITNWGKFPKNVYLVINQTNCAVPLTIEWEMYLWNLIEKFRINKNRIQLMKEFNEGNLTKFFSKCLKRRSIYKK